MLKLSPCYHPVPSLETTTVIGSGDSALSTGTSQGIHKLHKVREQLQEGLWETPPCLTCTCTAHLNPCHTPALLKVPKLSH